MVEVDLRAPTTYSKNITAVSHTVPPFYTPTTPHESERVYCVELEALHPEISVHITDGSMKRGNFAVERMSTCVVRPVQKRGGQARLSCDFEHWLNLMPDTRSFTFKLGTSDDLRYTPFSPTGRPSDAKGDGPTRKTLKHLVRLNYSFDLKSGMRAILLDP